MSGQDINSKIRANAKSAYFMIFVSILFLFNKNNKYINNDFVRSHTKIAFIIHIAFFLTYIIFITFGLGKEIRVFDIGLDTIFATIIFLFLFVILLLGFFEAHKGSYYDLSDVLNISKSENLVDINGDLKLTEKDKLTLILSYIPFLGYIVNGRYYKNKIVANITRFNLLSFLIITLFYIFGKLSIANILFLLYIIFSVFSSINLLANNKVISLNLPFLFSFEKVYIYSKALLTYLKNYFYKRDFVSLQLLNEETSKSYIANEKEELVTLNSLRDLKFNKYLIYIPILNLVFFFFLNTKYKNHIKNGLVITFLIIIFYIFGELGFLNKGLILLFIFPIFYGFGYLETRLSYKMPFIYIFSIIFSSIYKKIKNVFSKTKELRKTDKKLNLKVGEKNDDKSELKDKDLE